MAIKKPVALKKPSVEDEEDDRTAARRRFAKLELDDGARDVNSLAKTSGFKVCKIAYGVTKNLGSFESARIHLEAEVEDGHDWRDAFQALKAEVYKLSEDE